MPTAGVARDRPDTDNEPATSPIGINTVMKLSTLSNRLGSDAADAWHVHTQACQRRDRGEDILMLSIGEEAQETTADVVVESAVNSLRDGRHHYSEVRGSAELRSLIASQHLRLSGQQVTAQQCTVYAGAQNSLFSLAQCLLQTGDEVILPEPYYTTYPGVFTCTGASAVKVSGSHDRLYLASVEQIEKAITPQTRVIVITQPGNPMGSFYTANELEQLVNLCLQRQIWLISDEVYLQLLPEAERQGPARYDPECQCVVTVNSLSKSHRMTGWRLGWTVTPEPLAELLAELSMVMHYGMPGFIMDAAVTALQHDSSTVDEIRKSMNQRRDICRQHLQQVGKATLLESRAGMFVVLDVGETGYSAEEFALQLLQQQAVATLPCSGFGSNIDHLLRIGLCVPDNKLVEACQRISIFAQSLA